MKTISRSKFPPFLSVLTDASAHPFWREKMTLTNFSFTSNHFENDFYTKTTKKERPKLWLSLQFAGIKTKLTSSLSCKQKFYSRKKQFVELFVKNSDVYQKEKVFVKARMGFESESEALF